MPCEALPRRKVHTVLSLHNYDDCHSAAVFDKGPPSVGKVHVCGFEQEPVQGLAPLMEAGFKVLHFHRVMLLSPCPQGCIVFVQAAAHFPNACR